MNQSVGSRWTVRKVVIQVIGILLICWTAYQFPYRPMDMIGWVVLIALLSVLVALLWTINHFIVEKISKTWLQVAALVPILLVLVMGVFVIIMQFAPFLKLHIANRM